MAAVSQFTTAAPAASPSATAFPNNNVSGTTLYMLSLSTVTSEAITGITDTLGNTWVEVVDSTVGAFRFELWKGPNGSSGANSPSVSYSAFTASSKRVWIIEVADQGVAVNGPSNTLDVSGAVDPLTCATLTITAKGVAFLVVATDTVHTWVRWTNHFTDLGGGTTSRAAYRTINEENGGDSLAPTMDNSGTETGESLTVAMYDQTAGGGGGGEVSYVFG